MKRIVLCKTMEGKTEDLKKTEVCGKSKKNSAYVRLFKSRSA